MAISPDRSTEREHAASRWSREGDLVGPRHYIHHPSLNCRLLLERAGLQRHRLPGRSRKLHPLVRPDDLDSGAVGISCDIQSSWKWRLFKQN